MPRSMFPEISEETERSKNGRGFNGLGGKHVENDGQHVMSVRTPEGFVRKSTGQVADVRRPPVSAFHIIQAWSDLFIGKEEAYLMNTMKKEKSVLRNEENVHVFDFLVEVPSGAAAPIKYTPWKLTQLIKLQTEESKGSELRSTAAYQLFDGRRSERGRQVQAN